MRINVREEPVRGSRNRSNPKSPGSPQPPSLDPEEDEADENSGDEEETRRPESNETSSGRSSSPPQHLDPVEGSPGSSPPRPQRDHRDDGDDADDNPKDQSYWNIKSTNSSTDSLNYPRSSRSKALDNWNGPRSVAGTGTGSSLPHPPPNYHAPPTTPTGSNSVNPTATLPTYQHPHLPRQQHYTPCSSSANTTISSTNSIPGLFYPEGGGGGDKTKVAIEESGFASSLSARGREPPTTTSSINSMAMVAAAAAAHYLSVPPMSAPPAPADMSMLRPHPHQLPTPTREDAQLAYHRRSQHPTTHNQQHMWPSTSTRQSSRPDVVVENNASTSPFYPQHPDRGRPSKAAGYDTLDGGGSGICEPETDEGLDESLEEIAELEGELSSEGEELEGGGNFMGEMDCSRMNGRKSTTPFEGINFAQLFSASAAHSEQFINLAKQFYPKLQECLIQATAEMANVEAGYPVDKNSGTPMDSAFENVLCKLSSMLENCLFHMVDWVNRTEIFGILPVEDKMQLLYSSWSEFIVIEFLQCVIFNFQTEDSSHEAAMKSDRLGSAGSPSSHDLYGLVKDMLRYLLASGDTNQRICDLLSRFDVLRLSNQEFTCLKFLVIFNPHKHDVHLNLSYGYVRQVQSELCQFLLRSARRAAKRRAAAISLTPLPPFLATVEASERLGQLLAHLADVKHIAFTLESFLVARYYANCIPNASLLTEMLLAKRGRSMPPVPLPPSPAPPPPPAPPLFASPVSQQPQPYHQSGGAVGFLSPLPPTFQLKRDPSEYSPLPPPPHPHHDWRPRGSDYHQQHPKQHLIPQGVNPYFQTPHVPKYVSPGHQQPQQQQHQQDQSFFMGPGAQSQSQLQDPTFVPPPHTSASVI